ncbi:AraC family transcriptional regulator [Streptomyces albidoflavus]|uniref:helix-turn-helix domain-containing protein n=1 Tax=Streptomyces albidoflavus TaxID=1886 RepID=UPI0020C18888|nr:AraC family transcriptional regulator [Streptomyces albidoflavus]MCL6276323.1 AraC family transcriptional regulator [Streptomyces albidoflavus]MCX4463161.1 AraC family transcriptional regulator [Streptomyces albidoflavus]WSI95295.1 AraC family transcriptional regulator [Streptomyces albidoflavus]WTC34539.1 AraC family transcriptional regulator [Streptomyces albidoflavus]
MRCQEYGYGLGRPEGIFVLRYQSAGPLEFGAIARQDFLHQLYWSPDGALSALHGAEARFLGPGEAFWAQRAVSHEVRAADRQTVYRICLREVPAALAELRAGPVVVPEETGRLVRGLARSGVTEADALADRARIMAALVPYSFAGDGPPGAPASGRGAGHALRVARALAHDPSDTRELAAWAARLHISAKTLQRDFQREFGMSYTRWRTLLRLSAARALLGTEPVTRIARRVGYASPSAFVAAFAKEYGRTPARYARDGAGG